MSTSPSSGRRLVVTQVAQFALAGTVALAIVGLATSIASRRAGEREAISEARITTLIQAQGVIEPRVSDALVAGDADAVADLDEVVRRRVLDDSLVRVKIWSADGRIVYSDEARLIGERFELGEDELDALDTGRIDAEVSDLSEPENRFEQEEGKLLEVYLPISAESGERLLFEAYYRFALVESNGSELWRSFAPISLGALVMLELVQIPLAWSLARRLRDRLRERERLLQRALDASDVERRQIASDLHDGVVQDLAGVAYQLSAASRRGTGDVAGEEMAEVVRGSIAALRSLIVDIYPPDLGEVGLESALIDLLDRAGTRGLEVAVEVDPAVDDGAVGPRGLLYRVAQEGMRNTLCHADASSLHVRATVHDGIGVLEVTDDGCGFDPPAVGVGAAGQHLGLGALHGLVVDAGGTLEVTSAPGAGTSLVARVPLR